MALEYCELHPVSTLEQAEIVTPGQTGIAPYYFYIKPMEGYAVDKEDFTDNTFAASTIIGSQAYDPALISKIESIELSNTVGEDGEYNIDNKILVTVNLSPTYSISEDTQLVIDIDGRAISMGSRKIHISVTHDCRDLKSHQYEDGGVFVSGDMQIQMDIEIHDGGASGWNDQTMEQGVEENTTMKDIHPYGVEYHGYEPGDGLMPDDTADGVGHAFSSPNLGAYNSATGRDDVVVFSWTGVPDIPHRVATITFTPVIAQELIDQGIAGSFDAIPSLNPYPLQIVQNYIPTEPGFSIEDSIEHFSLVDSETVDNPITYEWFESNPNEAQITKCVMDLWYTPPLLTPPYNAGVSIADYNGDGTETVNWKPYFTTNIDIRGALSIKNEIEEDCTLWITAPALENPAPTYNLAYQLSELVDPADSTTWAQFPTSQEFGDGENNTTSMYDNPAITPATAELAALVPESAVQAATSYTATAISGASTQLYADWFIPSYQELQELYNANLEVPGLVDGFTPLGKVWSSSGFNLYATGYQAYYLVTSSGIIEVANTTDGYRVIPIRKEVYNGDMEDAFVGAEMLGGKVFYLDGDCGDGEGGGFTDPQNPSFQRYSINKVDFNFDKFPHGSRNIIPTRGIDKTYQPVVEIHGTPGSSFSVVFKETAVRESVTGKSLGSNTVDYFDGIIPDMPEGIVKIPKYGIYAFKFPVVAAWDTSISETGWKEFDMIITAGKDTLIKSNIKNSGGSIRDKNDIIIVDPVGELGASITNKFYQYPKVNIKIDAIKHDGSTYVSSPYNVTSVADSQYFGGSGTSKIGNAGSYIDKKYVWYTDNILPSSEDFEIRITKSATTFSLNTKNTEAVYDSSGVQVEEGGSGEDYKFYSFDSSVIKASIENNKDVVSFTRLRAHVGNGIGDDTRTHATIMGTIHYKKFGLQDQIYTIDLTQIFNNV